MIWLTTASCCMEDGYLGYLGASTGTGLPMWLAIPPTQPWAPVQSSRHSSHWANSGNGEGRENGKKMLTNRPKMYRKLLHPTTKTFEGAPCWSTLMQWWHTLSLQYHTYATDWKYQLLFVVNFVRVHLTAFKVLIDAWVDQLTNTPGRYSVLKDKYMRTSLVACVADEWGLVCLQCRLEVG